MQRRKSFFNNEMEQRFSLRKYTIGLCSVCLGFVVIGMGSQTVKADTVNGVEKSSAVQENKMQDASSANTDALAEAKANTSDSAATKPNTTPTETKENGAGSVAMAAPKTNTASNGANANEATPTETKLDKANSAAANSNNALAQAKSAKTESIVQPKVSGTSTEAKPNEHGSDAVNPNAVSTEVKLSTADPVSLAKVKPQETKLVKLVDTKTLVESKVATDNQFNFDDWTTQIDNTYLNITGYKGDSSKQIVVPNGADFAKAGKNDQNLQVEIGKDTLAGLIDNGVAPKLSNTDGQKIVAKGNNWGSAFSNKNLHDISGLANLDTSNVTDMISMFWNNQISDLSGLANWNTGNVTDMSSMFCGNLQISDLSPLANWNTGNVTDMSGMFWGNRISDLSGLANWNTGKVTDMDKMFYNNQISDLSGLANWNTGKVTDMSDMFNSNPLNIAINSQSILNKFHAIAYKLDNIGALASHSENKTFNGNSQILLDKNVVTNKDSATLTFKANSLAGNTYQIKIYNPDKSIDIQAAPLPTALGTTDTSYQDGYTIITNKFINAGSVRQDISIAQDAYNDVPNFAQYESTSGLITVTKDKENLGSIDITYQNVSDISNDISAPYIGNKPYVNHTQNIFYFKPQINSAYSNDQYSFIKSAGLTITVPDNVTIDPDTFIDAENGKALKATKIADNQYRVVLNNTTDGIAVKGLINVPADKLTNGTVHLPGFGMKYTINTYNDKVAPIVATDTSNELSVIPDLASYHGDLIKINQSKWAFNRNGNKVDDYISQGFTNKFNGVPLEPAVSIQMTNGVETFDMPAGVNITDFEPPFNDNVIDHIDCIHTDGSKETFGFLHGSPNAIRQIKIYFKNGIQSDNLFGYTTNFMLSFDASYPDGTPIKNFDTFKITGSFSCDELGSANNIDVAQVMLAPTQKLTDGMLTDTNQDESNIAPNASGNSINAIIRNDGLQHQGHLTNPIFYFKYNDLMVPDLSEISASYDNQNKELGPTGSINIDSNKIHSSIITDSAGQKFIKVQVDGEYYYGGSSDHESGFNVQIPISNSPDALTATKDWSWYILNNSNEAKTKSIIQNSNQGNKLLPVTIDGNTLSVGGTGTWKILVAQGFTSSTETQGNLNGGPGLVSTQDVHRQDPTHFVLYDSIINATDDAKSDLVSVTNLPSTQDGKSQFNVHMTGKASLINVMTDQTYDATITYSYGTGDNNFITGDQVTDWSKVKSIKVVPNGGAPSMTSLRLVVPVEDKTVYDDVGKTIYMSTMTYGEDKTNTNYTIKDGFAVPEKSTILPIIIKPGDAASAKLTVQGQATVHTLVHYKDANGKDVYVKLTDQDKTYNELQDTMKRSDYLQSDSDLTIADRGLLPTGMIIDYSNPTIRNSNNTYAAGYANGAAAFDKTAKYDFDGDQVIFEGAMPEMVTKTHQAKETIHYVYRDGRTAKPDKVLTSITLKQTGYKNPFTGEITWNTSATDTLNSVDSPEITGYIADKLTVPSYAVTMDSPDKEVTVTYDADNEIADFTYFDDTTNSTLKVVKKSGKSNTSIGYTTTDEINSYEKQGYTLVSDDTDGRNLNFDSLPTIDQHYTIHLKHKIESVPPRKDTVTRTIHYLYDNGKTAQPDKTQTVSFNETGTKDDVTGKTTWDNDDAQTVDSVTTPSITGYTPDQLSIEKQTFKFGDKDAEVTVTYHANTQTAKITYIDDTTKTNLKSRDASGKFGQVITFETAPTDEIASYEKQGYVFVSNSFDNNKYQADNSSNVFEVHLKHGTKKVSRSDDVNMTVHYVMDDNSKAPSDNKQTVNFTESGIQDLVTKHIDWTPADSQTFKNVVTPTMTGYTPDQDNVIGQTVNFGDKDVEVTVTYHANTQTAKITYIDDTTKTNLDSKNASGKFGQAITFATAPADEIASYENQGYVFVSNSFDNNKYQADDSSNIFYVHLKHGTKKVSRSDDVNMTVHYVMDDNSKAPSDNKQTVNFTENGIQDLVTNHIDWTPADSQTLKDVDSPVLTGYTADIKTANGKAVNFGDPDINVTVTYHANMQTATITYIDDTTKTNLKSTDTSGKFGQAITFATVPADEIENYKKQGYVLVSSTFDNNKYQADNSSNIFYVHLKHDTKDVSRDSNVKMTVHYVMDDNSEAPSDNKQSLSFTENGSQDLVTKHIDWTPADSQTFKDVDSPVLTGYTADIKTANGKVVNFGDNDINVTVHYSANTQTATITYIDDTEKKTLGSDNQNGKFNQVIAFEHDPAEVIKGFEEKGYVFVSNSFDHQKYQADNSNNVFKVHFVHGTKDVSRSDDVNMTVHYVMDDNSEAPSDNKQTVNFTENGIQDLVTKHIDWTTANSQTFKDVVTPTMTGYTPDQDTVTGQTVNFGDNDVEVTVRYSPNVQIGHINYIDDDTKKTLTRDDFSGRTNEHEDYTSTDRIQEFENKGYELVSNDYPEGGFNFDNNDRQDQVFNVHFKHGTVTVTTKNPQTPNTPINPDPQSPKYPEDISNTNSDVKRTIDYMFKNGKTAQPTVKDSLHFERTVVIDKVTGDVLSDTWTQSQNFSDIQTPAIQGYTPDRTVVSDKNIGHDHQDIIEHVVYNPDAQHMTITYIDDTTGETLHTDKRDGVSDQDAKYTTSDTIKQYEDQHYKLVSDSTKGQDLIFDHDDNADQTYEVHFIHGKHAIDQTTSPKQTIHYVYADGLARQGKAADDNVQQLSFERDGYNDEVTGTDHWNTWIPANNKYNAVDSPVVQGYTPDKLVVEKSTANPTDKDIEVTVVYNADKQAARVIYVDKTTNDTLTSKDLSGKSDEDSEYDTKDTIGQYKSQHYVLFEDETNGKNVVFDHDDQQDQTYYVYFVHDTQKVSRQSVVTSTIDYKFEDGKTAQPTVTQTKYFNENGVKDLVTGKITWDESTPQKFDDIATKSIVGYTPDKDNVTGSTVNFGDKDITETVTYHNNAQKAVITYVDDMTNNTLASDSQDGKFDHEIAFSHKPSDVILGFEKAGYKLVSNNFKDGTKYKADDKQNEFIVHLIHDMQKVNRQDQVVETIHYVYENGSKSQPDHEQTISFTEDGIKDLVTGKITWDEAKPQKFDDVITPAISGYTPDKGNVTGSTVRFGDKDVEVTVTYHNNAQKAVINYIDDTEKKTLGSDQQNGKFNQVITFKHDPADVIKGLEEKGYKLISNDFNSNKYQADNSKNVFNVHFIHGTHAISDKYSITETVTYVMSDGSKAPDKVEKQVEFSRDGYNDEVTKQDHWNKWQPNKQSFSAVPTPEVKGYTPDIKSVAAKTVIAGDKDITVTVTYSPDKQKAKVVFIDDTTKKTLDTHNLMGVTNGHEKYNPSEEIEKFIHDNYVFVSSDYPEKGFTYDNDDSKDQVFEVHFKERPTESDTPTIPDNTEGNSGSNDTPTGSNNPEKDNGGSDTDKSSHKTPVKRHDNNKHHGTKKTSIQKNVNKNHQSTKTTNIPKTSKTAKLNSNRFAQPKLEKAKESTNSVNRIKYDALPQTGEKRSSLMAMLGLAISGLGMIGAMKSKKRKDD